MHKHQITTLIQEYILLEDGVFIAHHNQLIAILSKPKVFISRRALKHFVERRKGEILKNHTFEYLEKELHSIIFYVPEVVLFYDYRNQDEDGKILFEKVYDNVRSLKIRVVVDVTKVGMEIKSIHPVKIKTSP